MSDIERPPKSCSRSDIRAIVAVKRNVCVRRQARCRPLDLIVHSRHSACMQSDSPPELSSVATARVLRDEVTASVRSWKTAQHDAGQHVYYVRFPYRDGSAPATGAEQ